jgi:nucleoid DNA-binding protein
MMSDKKLRNKKWLIQNIAKRSHFTQGDVEAMLNMFIKIVHEIIQEKEILLISNFIKISVTEIPEHNGWNAALDKSIVIPPSNRIIFRASRRLLNLFREVGDSDYSEEEEDFE